MADERILMDRIEQAELKISNRQDKKGLELNYRGKKAYLKESLGAHYLREIVLHPRQSICVYDLAAMFCMDSIPKGISSDSPEELAGMGLYPRNYASREPILDQKAIGQIKQRLVWLNERLAELISWNDHSAAEDLLEEREALIEYLSTALNVHGRSKSLPDELGRIKAATLKSIRRAIRSIESQAPELGQGLRASISLGTTILYQPQD